MEDKIQETLNQNGYSHLLATSDDYFVLIECKEKTEAESVASLFSLCKVEKNMGYWYVIFEIPSEN